MPGLSEINWQCKAFSHLTNGEVYDLLQLRNEVFVVEQNCIYQDCDNKDKQAFHLSGYLKNKLVAYSRLLPLGASYPDGASIGRIVTSPSVRGKNIGRTLVEAAIQKLYEQYGKVDIIISAQAHLQKFYASLGFQPEGALYEEDGIPHIQMRLMQSNSH